MRRKNLIFIWGMLAFPIFQWVIFFGYVNINSVLMAFQFRNAGTVVYSLKNFERFFQEATQLDWVRISVTNSLRAALNNLLLMFLSLFCAYWFYKKMPGRGVFRFVFYLPSIISIVIYTTVYKYMFNMSMGPINILLEDVFNLGKNDLPQWFGDRDLAFSMILFYCIWVGLGHNVLIYGGVMENLDGEVMEYSRMEGVGVFRELFQIVLPMMWPTITVGILGTIQLIFTFFIQVELLTQGGPDQSSQSIGFTINNLIRSGYFEWGACVGIIYTFIAAPIIIIAKIVTEKVSNKFGF